MTHDDLNTSDFVAWKNSECTQKFKEFMREHLEEMKTWLLKDAFYSGNAHEDACKAARTQGNAQFCTFMIEVIDSIHLPLPNLEEIHEE